MPNMENQDSSDDMQAAFQQFMLSGGRKAKQSNQESSGTKKKKKGRNTPQLLQVETSPSPSVSVSDGKANQHSIQRHKIRKQIWQILNGFQKVLKEDWLDADDHCGKVLASIVNLRERIRKTSKYLWEYQEFGPQQPSSLSKRSGYRTYPPGNAALGFLTEADLELGLSHGLIQHEKMLAGLRKLISSLNQAQEALGRRLDELLIFHLDMSSLIFQGMQDKEEQDNYYDLQCFVAHVVHWCQQVYSCLAVELFRKQQLLHAVLESAMSDTLLYHEDIGNIDDDSSPIKVAEKCRSEWARGGSVEEDREYFVSLMNATPWEQTKNFG